MHFYPSPDAYSSEERQDCYILVKHLFCVYKEAVKLLIIDNQLVGVLAHLKASDIWAHKKCLSFSQVLWHILNTAQLKTYFPKTSQTITDTVKLTPRGCTSVTKWVCEPVRTSYLNSPSSSGRLLYIWALPPCCAQQLWILWHWAWRVSIGWT